MAEFVETNPDWRPGDALFVRGLRWTVADSLTFGACRALRLVCSNPERQVRRTILLPFDRPKRLRIAPSIQVVRSGRWLRSLLQLAMNSRPLGSLASAARSQIDILPYQLEPALAMLRYGCNRIMIADDVGLGKTVQAGLIIAALAEQDVFRALIVTPAGLRDQWAQELSDRFGITASIMGSLLLAQSARELPRGINPWSLPGIYMCSYEYLRRPEVLRPLEEVGWDLLVMDEAHAATVGSARRAAVHAVALRSKRVVFLTATPHAGDDEQFRALCRIGSADQSDKLTLFRRSRGDVTAASRRRRTLLAVHLSDAERRVHRLLEGYTSSVCRESRTRGNVDARLAAIVLRKRALSGPRSLSISCRRRLALLTGESMPVEREQLSLPLEDNDCLADEVPESALAAPGLANAARERAWLESIIVASDAAAQHDSKLAALVRLLRRVKEPVIVFTEYRDTLDQIRRACRRSHPDALMLHGGLVAGDRAAIQQQFNRRGALLLATDAAAEGLNLQHRCRTVIHFELPWAPSRLQQRAGRVDRIGQQRLVHEIMLVADDTAERLVLAPLARRARRAARIIAGGAALVDTLSESQIAAAIMDGESSAASARAMDDIVAGAPEAVASAARIEAACVEDLRRWSKILARCPVSGRIPAYALRMKRRRLSPGIVAIYALTLASRDGYVAHTELLAFHYTVAPYVAPRTPSQVRALLSRFARDEAAARTVPLQLAQDRIDRASHLCSRAAASLAERERIAAIPMISAAQQIVQAGLFDQRAVRVAARRHRDLTALAAELERRVEFLDSQSTLTPSLALSALLVLS